MSAVLPIALDPVAQNIIMRPGAYLHPVVVTVIHQRRWATSTTATAALVAVIKGQNVSVSDIRTRVSVFVGPFIVSGMAHSSFDSFAFVRVLALLLLYLVLG